MERQREPPSRWKWAPQLLQKGLGLQEDKAKLPQAWMMDNELISATEAIMIGKDALNHKLFIVIYIPLVNSHQSGSAAGRRELRIVVSSHYLIYPQV